MASKLNPNVMFSSPDVRPKRPDLNKASTEVNGVPDYSQATFTYSFGDFSKPMAVSVSPDTGNVVVSDIDNHQIVILDEGQCLSAFGGQGDGDGQFSTPSGVAIDSQDNIVVVDKDNHRIQVMDFEGNFKFHIGCKGVGNGQFQNPHGVAVGKDDVLYIGDGDNYRIQVLKSDGTFVRSIGRKGSSPGQFRTRPWFVALSQNGKVVVSDEDGRLYVFTTTGQHLKTIERGRPSSFMKAQGIVIDKHDNIIVADFYGRVFVLNEEGKVVCSLGSPGSGQGQLKEPRGIALASNGDLLLCDYGNNRMHVIEVPSESM